MLITDVHEPTLVSDHRLSYVLWTWRCTCGGFSLTAFRSQALATIDHHAHRYPDTGPPTHTMKQVEGGFGGPAWTCTCGHASRPEGQQDERRMRQTFNRHVTTATLHWLAKYHETVLGRLTPDQRERRAALIAWAAKDPATRHAQTKYVLEQLL